MDSIPLARWMPAFDSGDYRAVAGFMVESTQLLASVGADFAICPDNSAHPHVGLPHAAVADTVVAHRQRGSREAKRRGHRRVGVLGTRFTMEGPVYRDALGEVDIEAVLPEPADIQTVDRIIFTELVNGIVTTPSVEAYTQAVDRLRSRGCDAVALACTEIPMLLSADTSPLPTLDSTLILAQAALREAQTSDVARNGKRGRITVTGEGSRRPQHRTSWEAAQLRSTGRCTLTARSRTSRVRSPMTFCAQRVSSSHSSNLGPRGWRRRPGSSVPVSTSSRSGPATLLTSPIFSLGAGPPAGVRRVRLGGLRRWGGGRRGGLGWR